MDKRKPHQKWANIVKHIELLDESSSTADAIFESVCRELWNFSQDEEAMQSMEFASFYDIWKDPDIMQLIESPAVLYKIDLHSYVNQNRFYNLLWWDTELPELGLLKQKHLTPMTQRPGAIGNMKSLLTSQEKHDKKVELAREILLAQKESKERDGHIIEESIHDGNLDISVDGTPAVRIKGKLSDPYTTRFRSRMLSLKEKDKWLIKVMDAKIFLCTDKGMEQRGILLTDDDSVLRYLSSRGFKVDR